MKSLMLSLKRFVRKYILPRPEIQKLPLEKRKRLLAKLYKQRMGAKLNWNNLRSFTEKIQWLKLYYHHPDMGRCVDKYGFKEYIREKVGEGYTASLIKVWSAPEDVSIRDIPANKFVIKSNLQYGGRYIIPVIDKEKLDIETVEKEIKENWFNPNNLMINSFCRAYYDVKPRVLVEEFIEEFDGIANDYKLFCFSGEPAFFYVAEEHFKDGKNTAVHPVTFFDKEWNVMDVTYGEQPRNPAAAKPKHMEEMIRIARLLSKEFPFVRVDFFDTEEKLYLAELTFYPGGGLTAYHPQSFNEKLGNMLPLPKVEQ